MRAFGVLAVSICMIVHSACAGQRRVLAELFTATWCTYCPLAQAAIDSLVAELGPQSLVVLKYHVSDGLAIPEGEARGGWYNGASYPIPNMWFDGMINVIGGWTGVRDVYRSHIEDRLDVSSPFVIVPGLSMGESAGDLSARIEVVEPFSEVGLKAHFVLYENGVNNEYNHVVREILPSEDLTISALGDSVLIRRDFNVDPRWQLENIGIGIFVQSDTSREVLQALALELPMLYSNLSMEEFSISDSLGNHDGRADPGDTVEMCVTLFNETGWQDAETVSMTLSTDDSFLVVLDSVAQIPYIAAGSTASNQDNPFRFEVLPCSAHWAQFRLDVSASPDPYPARTQIFTTLIGRPPLIVIDDDDGAHYEQYFFNALDSLGVLYDCSNWLPLKPHLETHKYQTAIWLTGDDSLTTLSREEIDSLQSFLGGGGNLFISGQGIGEDIGFHPFYSDYLHAEWLRTASGDYFVFGLPGDEIADGLSFVILGAGGASNQTSQDILSPLGGADSIFVYSQGGVAGVKYEGNYKVVYFGFGFEAINDLVAGHSDRSDCLREILNWFGYHLTEVAEVSYGDTQERTTLTVSPSPFRSATTISFSLRQRSPVTLRVYDSSGRLVHTLLDRWADPGISITEWDGRDSRGLEVSSGIYFFQLINSDGAYTEKSICIR